MGGKYRYDIMARIELGYWGCPNCGTAKVIIYGDKKRQCNGCGREDVLANEIYETPSLTRGVAID